MHFSTLNSAEMIIKILKIEYILYFYERLKPLLSTKLKLITTIDLRQRPINHQSITKQQMTHRDSAFMKLIELQLIGN